MELGVFLPGVVLCNETQPCSNIQFINVKNHGEFIVQSNYVCQNVENFISTSSNPSLSCTSSPNQTFSTSSPSPISPKWNPSFTLSHLLEIFYDKLPKNEE